MNIGTILKIAYNPPLTQGLKNWIKKYITPSMVSQDETTNQYGLDMIWVETQEVKYEVKDNDASILQECINQSIEYLEF